MGTRVLNGRELLARIHRKVLVTLVNIGKQVHMLDGTHCRLTLAGNRAGDQAARLVGQAFLGMCHDTVVIRSRKQQLLHTRHRYSPAFRLAPCTASAHSGCS